jgi:DTW domain-containing protein YfiP
VSGVSAPRGFRQARCAGCGLNPEACVCALFRRLDSPLTLSVVMPRSEARSASNSARLLALWLPGVEVSVRGGEATAPSPESPSPESPSPESLLSRPNTALLFPGGSRGGPLPTGIQHLIIPDGTWAQARRIERRWFAAAGLPRVELEGPWPSVYELRRGREGLCTFEAAAVALGLLSDRALGAALLGRFAEWARRARLLKLGGRPNAPRVDPSLPLPEHPAAALLLRLPAGTGDARRASAESRMP